MARRGYKTIRADLTKAGETSVYTSPRVADALEKIIEEATVYEGVKLLQICEAFYLPTGTERRCTGGLRGAGPSAQSHQAADPPPDAGEAEEATLGRLAALG